MIKQAAYGTEPWRLIEKELDLDLLAQSESIFALSNGHIGLRGNLDEGEPHGLPGTYLNSMYEVRPLPYAEAGYGFPDSGQTVINVTNGKLIRLLVDDEPFDIRYGNLHSHKRVLDLRAGADPDRRLVLPGRGQDQGDLGAHGVADRARHRGHQLHGPAGGPQAAGGAAVRAGHQRGDAQPAATTRGGRHPGRPAGRRGAPDLRRHAARVVLVHRTRSSGLRMAAGMWHEIYCPEKMGSRTESTRTWAGPRSPPSWPRASNCAS